ncbi:MAG: ATP-binding protein [Phycisphaerae bacterium]
MPDPIKMTIISDPSNIGAVRTAVEAFGERNGFTREQSDQAGLAVNEALANVIKHAYDGNSNQFINITLDMVADNGRPGRALKIVIRDFGRHVDLECIKSRSLSEVRPGGLGVHIIKTVMDDVNYRCVPEGGMELTMLKYIVPTQEAGK